MTTPTTIPTVRLRDLDGAGVMLTSDPTSSVLRVATVRLSADEIIADVGHWPGGGYETRRRSPAGLVSAWRCAADHSHAATAMRVVAEIEETGLYIVEPRTAEREYRTGEQVLTEHWRRIESAAELLGITRHAAKRKIIKHGIRWPRSSPAALPESSAPS